MWRNTNICTHLNTSERSPCACLCSMIFDFSAPHREAHRSKPPVLSPQPLCHCDRHQRLLRLSHEILAKLDAMFHACNSTFNIPTPHIVVHPSYSLLIFGLHHHLLPHTNRSIRRNRTNSRWQLQRTLLSQLLQLLLPLVFHYSSLLEVCDL